MVFVDRQSRYPNRWTLKKSDGTSEVVTLIRNDEPVVEGTPMNAATLNELSTVAGALNAKEAAAASAAAALASQNAAKTSETNAYNSAFAANNSASAAASSKEAAASSEASVAANASAAAESASAAAASQKAAKTSETNSKASETNAKASETAAKTSERNASFSASSASTSEKNASESEKNASVSASSASASATSASNSASQAADSAIRAEAIVSADKTLTVSGAPADAKVVGDKLNERYTKSEVDRKIEDVHIETDATLTVSGAAADAKVTGDALAKKLPTDSAGYVKSVSVSGTRMTLTFGDGTTQTHQLAESYTLPTATASTLGGVKVGANITNSSGTISLTKSNVESALGYTPTIAPYSITYEGYYLGTDSGMSSSSPHRISLSRLYDRVVIAALDGTTTPLSVYKLKYYIFRSFSYYDYKYGFAQKNNIGLHWLTSTFANSKNAYDYYVEGDTSGNAMVRLNGTTIELYGNYGYEIFNRRWIYYVFGMDTNVKLE